MVVSQVAHGDVRNLNAMATTLLTKFNFRAATNQACINLEMYVVTTPNFQRYVHICALFHYFELYQANYVIHDISLF